MKPSHVKIDRTAPARPNYWMVGALFIALALGIWIWRVVASRAPSNISIPPVSIPSSIPVAPPVRVKSTLSKPTRDSLERCVTEAISQGQCAGAVVLVGKGDKLLYHAAFGNAMVTPQKRAMEPDEIFDMASLTKCLATATSIMLLIEQGRLSLSDKVARVLPGFRGDADQVIRVRDLLTHTSGLTDDLLHDSDSARFFKNLCARFPGLQNLFGTFLRPRDVIGSALASGPVTAPGARYLYADINFILLGEVVKSVSGLPLDQFFDQNIAKPLGLQDTGFCPPASKNGRIAATEKIGDTVLVGVVHDPRSRELFGVAGHAGLFSTAREVWMMARMLLNGGVLGEKQLMSPATASLMTSIQTPAGLTPRGLGWEMDYMSYGPRGDLFPHEGFGHTGYTGTSLWADKATKTVVIILSNRVHPEDKGDVSLLRRRVANVVAAEVYRTAGLAAGKRQEASAGLAANVESPKTRVSGGSR